MTAPRSPGVLAGRVGPIAALALALLGAAPASSSAETLAEAIVDAYRNNPELQAQRAELRALDESVIEAGAPYRMGAQLSGNINANDRRQRSASFDGFTVFEQRNIGVALTVTQILSNGGRTAAQLSAAEADVLGGRERLREAENTTLFEVIDAYVSVRRDQQLIAIQQDVVANYERQVSQNRSREREGDLSRTDVTQAEAQLLIIRAALAQAQANLERSRSRFAAVVGRNPGVLQDEPALPLVPISSDAAQAAGERESPIVWQAVLAERGSRHRIAAARAERNPVVSASGSAGFVNPAGFRLRDMGSNVGGGVTFTLPLLTQGVVGSRVRAAIAQQQSAQFRVETARRTVAAGILNAWNQAVTAQAQLRVGDAAVQAAEAAVGGVRRGFAEGFRSNFEVIDSEQRLLNARTLVVNARYSLYAAQATLLAFIGRLQADGLVHGVTDYPVATNLKRRRAEQVGPFEPLFAAYDSLSRPSGRSRPAPAIAPVPRAEPVAATAPAPDGPLATALPHLTGPGAVTTLDAPTSSNRRKKR